MERLKENLGISLMFGVLGGTAGAVTNKSLEVGVIDAIASGVGSFAILDGTERINQTAEFLRNGRRIAYLLHGLATVTEVSSCSILWNSRSHFWSSNNYI